MSLQQRKTKKSWNVRDWKRFWPLWNFHAGRIEWKHADGTRWCIQDKADLTKIDVVRYTTGGEKPVINRVKTVDGERNFIQNLKPEKVRDGYRARVFFRLERGGRDSRSWPGGGRNLQLSRTQSVSLPAQYEDSQCLCLFPQKDMECCLTAVLLMTFNDEGRESYLFLDTVDQIDYYFHGRQYHGWNYPCVIAI